MDAFLTESVNALRFPNEHDLQLFSFWVLIDEICEAEVDEVLALANVDRLFLCQRLREFMQFPYLLIRRLLDFFELDVTSF